MNPVFFIKTFGLLSALISGLALTNAHAYSSNTVKDSGNMESNQIAQSKVCKFKKQTPNIKVRAIEPCQNNIIPGYRPYISGNVTDPKATVWLVVHPMSSPDYYVQDGPISVKEDGTWTTRPYFGDSINGRGEKFQFKAILTTERLTSGQKLSTWPKGQASEMVTVTRQ